MNLDPNHALVILSGGQDSTTCLGWALARYKQVSCVTFDYNQRHRREIEAARAVVNHFSFYEHTPIHHEVVELGPILAGTSPLTNPHEQLELYESHDEMEAIIGDRVEKTFVPMRNMLFLTIAANRAVVLGAGRLVTGVCQADNANYPDCRMKFLTACDWAMNCALGLERDGDAWPLTIEAPLMDMTKAQSIELARSLPATYDALALSHTAYDGSYPPTSKDHASVLRAHGFEQAGYPDPLVVRAWREGLMELPQTSNYDGLRAHSQEAS